MLPPFLQPLYPDTAHPDPSGIYPRVAAYTHSSKLAQSVAHCLWWPSKNTASNPTTILLFVPGNPGLVDFYIPYLSHVHEASLDSLLAILAHSLLGHSPRLPSPSLHFSSLDAQIECIIETIDDIGSTFGSDARIVLIAHSVGSWIVLQALRERSERVTAVFMLFPTITHIIRTPNGDRLSWLFKGVIPKVASLASNIFRVLPKASLSLVLRDWPPDQIDVVWNFLRSPSAILACLTMAGQEMNTINELDLEHFGRVKHQLFFFFAERDDWVARNRETILREMSGEPHSVRVVHGRYGIPHAYCINHGKELAEQTIRWLEADIFVPGSTKISHR